VATSPCQMEWLDGSPARQLSETVGGSVYRPVSPVHMLTNHGDDPYRNRLIELLDLGEEASGEAQTVADDVPAESSFDGPGEVPTKVVVDEEDVRVQHVTPEAGETYTWRTGAYPALVVDLDLTTASVDGVRYLQPGETYTLPSKLTRTSGYNLVELRYFSTS
jgi:hypothetical protein